MTAIFRIAVNLLFVILCTFAVSCNNDASDDDVAGEVVSIAYLKSQCRGDHYRIAGEYAICGTVVASDWLGELYKTILVVDDTAGVEVAIDSHNIAGWLPIYSKVKISCNGLMLARVGGKIELGAVPTGGFLLDNIDEDIAQRIISVEGIDEDFAPTIKHISEIGTSDISLPIRIEGLRIVESERGLTWCESVEGKAQTTVRTAVDADGNTIAIQTLASCRYALQAMPSEEFSVVGVIEYSNSTYTLRIINKGIFYL